MLRNLRQFWFDTMEGTDRNQWTHFLHNAKRFRKKVLTKKNTKSTFGMREKSFTARYAN